MKELTFTSFNEFQQSIRNKATEKGTKRGLVGEELETFTSAFIHNCLKMWEENECDYWLEKHGYVIITVEKQGETKRKVTRGRPKKLDAQKYLHSIHVRLDDYSHKRLQQYCEENKVDVSEVIRNLIRTL